MDVFYGNSLRRYDAAGLLVDERDALADFASIPRHADGFVPADASVLEIGCCFGFLSLRLARAGGRSVIAADLSAGTVGLLRLVAERLGLPLQTLVAGAARIPRSDDSVDVVLLVHLLEHLDADHCRRAIDEALRVATRRVVIAVPYEDEPTAAFGHLRTIDETDLRGWAAATTGRTWSVHVHRLAPECKLVATVLFVFAVVASPREAVWAFVLDAVILVLVATSPGCRWASWLAAWCSFQDPDDQLFSPTVRDDVAFGPKNLGYRGHNLDHRVEAALRAVGMAQHADRAPHHLSFGQRRRVATSTVLSMDPTVLVLDEPSSNLDPLARRELADIVLSLGLTTVIVTHDLLVRAAAVPAFRDHE